jgi:hypothetical protein
MFFGAQPLKQAINSTQCSNLMEESFSKLELEAMSEEATINENNNNKNNNNNISIINNGGSQGLNYLVTSRIGFATIHWGKHPHLVTPLEKGIRTNVIMTMCFVDKNKSKAMKTDCFQDESLK